MLDYIKNLHPVIQALIATGFTWFMTAAGSAIVFLGKNIKKKLLDGMLGFAAGVMIAASFWSLLAPAIEMSKGKGMPTWIPPMVGFLLGGFFLRIIDKILESLGIKVVRLSDVINRLISKGFQRAYSRIKECFSTYSNNPDVEYLATNITAAIQLCDRLAASITRGGLDKGLRRLEQEFVRYCLNAEDKSIKEFLTRIRDEASHELRNIIFR